MKKFFFYLLFLILCLPFFSSVEFTLKENFSQGETIIAKISGTFLSELTNSNIFFYRDHYKIPIDHSLTKINGEYYLFASLGDKSEGNYSISLEEVQYNQGTTTSTENIVRPFKITQEKALFSVNPGFLITKEDFFLEVKNLAEISIEIKVTTPSKISEQREIFLDSSQDLIKEKSFLLISGKTEKIKFKLGDGNSSLQFISISSGNFTYEIPIFSIQPEEQVIIQNTGDFSLEPSQAIYQLPSNSIIKKTFYLYNLGTSELTNLSISVSDSLSNFVNISTSNLEKLEANTSLPLELTLYSKEDTQIDGQIRIETKGKLSYSSVSLNFSSQTNSSNTRSQEYSSNSCEALKGTICASGQTCSIETITSTTGLCCKGVCRIPGSVGSNKKVIAVSIILLLVILAGWFYFKKFKNTKNSVNLLDIAKK